MRQGKGFLVLAALLLAIGIFVGVGFQGQAQYALGQSASTPTVAPAEVVTNQTQLFRSIYTRVNPSVVSIDVQIQNQNSSGGFGFRNQGQGQGQFYQAAAGSGFVYYTQGHIVTNAHVVQNTTSIEVTFSDGNTMRAKLTGIDLDSDLAVIQVEGNVSQYTPVALGDSDAVQVGDGVVAIGNPFQEAGTMTSGIVSALHRTVQGLRTNSTGSYSIPDAIQTDAALNPGNSGGPLLNESGQVIGVNEQIEAPAGQSSGISFAISSNLVRQVVPVLIQSGSIDHPYLGVSTTSLTLDIDSSLHLPDSTRGALVTGISSGSPAEKAGLEAATTSNRNTISVSGGDIITAVDKQPIHSADDLISYLFTKTKVGQTVTLTVLRNGKSQDISVTLEARPNQG